MKSHAVRWVKNHKYVVIGIAAIAAVTLVLFGGQIWLYISFLLGNDTVVRLKADKEVIFLVHGQDEEIQFEASVTTNFFCTATCKSEFIDISKKKTIEREVFNLRTGNDHEMGYMLTAARPGRGIDLYRLDLECRSRRSFFCHTSEEPTTRSILVTVEYGLNETEMALSSGAKNGSVHFAEEMVKLRAMFERLRGAAIALNQTVVLGDTEIDQLHQLIVRNENHLDRITAIWETQDFQEIQRQLEIMETDLQTARELFQRTNSSVAAYAASHNALVDRLWQLQRDLSIFQSMELTNFSSVREINQSIAELALLDTKMQMKDTLGRKESEVKAFGDKVQHILSAIRDEIKHEVLARELELNIVLDVLCAGSGVCADHNSVDELAYREKFELNTTCARVERVRDRLTAVNASLQAAFAAQNYPVHEGFWNNVSALVRNMQNDVQENYTRALPINGTNTPTLKELLVSSGNVSTEDYAFNLTPALVHALAKEKHVSCVLYNESRDLVAPITLRPIVFEEVSLRNITFELADPIPWCCSLGECRTCCDSEACSQDPGTFPILFLHGHAVNKDLSAEYSLEGFNKIQNKLEEDGFLSAGAITLFTERDTPYGIWGRFHTPLTIRSSYYFDIFKEPENYVVIQTKSENIDTYAIRLKEIVDTVKYKTGKPKVKIVAFSMGGLVARRYVQIFGSDSVETLVLIGTPNKGVVGDVADYCQVIGEKLECRDLNANSLFINKLNQGKLPDIPIHNIVGTGCAMDEGDGDGTVLQERGVLEGAQNYIVKGTCKSAVYPLHLEMRDIDVYPEVYEIVKKALS